MQTVDVDRVAGRIERAAGATDAKFRVIRIFWLSILVIPIAVLIDAGGGDGLAIRPLWWLGVVLAAVMAVVGLRDWVIAARAMLAARWVRRLRCRPDLRHVHLYDCAPEARERDRTAARTQTLAALDGSRRPTAAPVAPAPPPPPRRERVRATNGAEATGGRVAVENERPRA